MEQQAEQKGRDFDGVVSLSCETNAGKGRSVCFGSVTGEKDVLEFLSSVCRRARFEKDTNSSNT